MDDPCGKSVLAPLYEQLNDEMRAIFGGTDSEEIGMDPIGFLMDSPLTSLLHFLGSFIPTSPEETVDELLAKVYSIA
jgi:hypothetical protein